MPYPENLEEAHGCCAKPDSANAGRNVGLMFLFPLPGRRGAEYFKPNAAPAAKSKANATEEPASNSKKLNIYFWRGHGIEAGYLTNKSYMRLIKAICRKHNFRFDLRPDKDKLLAGLAWADVAYGTVHAGFSPTILKHSIPGRSGERPQSQAHRRGVGCLAQGCGGQGPSRR